MGQRLGCVPWNKGKTSQTDSRIKTGEKASNWRGGPILRICQRCGKDFTVKQCVVKKGRGQYCSRLCQTHGIAKREGANHRWNGGRTVSGGYVYLRNLYHPHATKRGYVAEHRLITEDYLGRYLQPWEIVHHKNGIKDDNRIENLELLPNGKHNTRVQEVFLENQKLKLLLVALLATHSGYRRD